MADEQVDSSQSADQTTQVEATEPTLEDVYKSVDLSEPNKQEVQREVQQQPQQQQTRQEPAPVNVPDPYDTEAFKRYMADVARGQSTLQQGLQAVGSFLTNMQAREARAKMETDIAKAVEVVNEVVGHPKPKVIEAMIDAKAREDVRFKALWEKREQNPTAWQSALKAVAKEFAADVSIQVDPRLVAAQQARKLAQKQMATTAKESPEDSWDGLNQDQFEAKWNQMVSGGN